MTIRHKTVTLLPLAELHKQGHLLFAGRRWIVMDVDVEHHEIHVKPARGWKRPKFSGGPGEVHSRVRQKMREVLGNDGVCPYLDKQASDLLAYARRSAADAGVCMQSLLELGPRHSALMTWTGSRIGQNDPSPRLPAVGTPGWQVQLHHQEVLVNDPAGGRQVLAWVSQSTLVEAYRGFKHSL